MNFSLNLYLYNIVFKQQRHNNEREDNKVVTVDTGDLPILFSLTATAEDCIFYDIFISQL